MRMQYVLAVFVCGVMWAADAPRPAGIPKEAVEKSEGLYEYRDKEGRTWYWRKSPFGWLKSGGLNDAERKKLETEPPREISRTTPFGPRPEKEMTPSPALHIKAFEDGENVRFESTSPFGPVKWTKKKTDLTPDEQSAWDRARGESNAKVQKQQ